MTGPDLILASMLSAMVERRFDDPELERRFLAFQTEYPEAAEYLALYMADAGLVELEDPAAAAILRRELPELAG